VFLKFTENIFFVFLVRLKNNKFETRLTKHDFLNHAKIINDVSNTNELYENAMYPFSPDPLRFAEDDGGKRRLELGLGCIVWVAFPTPFTKFWTQK